MQERRMAKSKGQHHEDYKKKAREVKQITRRDKKKYIEDKCEQIENNFSKNRSRDAYNIIKSLTKTFQPKTVVIKDENGNVLTESRFSIGGRGIVKTCLLTPVNQNKQQ